jgi:hypothetical protein
MEAATIGCLSLSQTGREVGLMLLKGRDERLDDGLKLGRCSPALRIEPD